MKFEDHFSQLAETYSRYRPGFPASLFEFLAGCCKYHDQAWDCGTGNGQAALALTHHFNRIIATDGSKEQIEKAIKHPKVIYRVETAEDVLLPDQSTDLVTVAVAVHWFDFERFYRNVKRILKPGGVIAVWTYSLIEISPEIDILVNKYMNEILAGYWPERFEYVKKKYKTLPFPFEEITAPEFQMKVNWDLNSLGGFLSSWSGTKNYLNKTGEHPLNKIWDDLKKNWGDENKPCQAILPLNIRIGKV